MNMNPSPECYNFDVQGTYIVTLTRVQLLVFHAFGIGEEIQSVLCSS